MTPTDCKHLHLAIPLVRDARRSASVLAVLLAVCLTAEAAGPSPIVGAWPDQGVGFVEAAVAMNGVACVMTRNAGLMVFDLNQPKSPRWLASVNVGNPGRGLALVGRTLYVGAETNFLVMNLEDASKPVVVGSCRIRGYATALVVEGGKAYVGQGWNCGSWRGLEVIDVADPAQPVVRGAAALGGDPNTWPAAMGLRGTNLFMGAYFGGLLVFDVSDPQEPRQVGSLTGDVVNQLVVAGEHLLWNLGDTINILDATDPCRPQVCTNFAVPSGGGSCMTREGNRVVVAGNNGVYFLDVANPTQPTVEAHLFTPNSMGVGCGFSSGHYYFLYSGHMNELLIVDAVNPAQPSYHGSFPLGRDANRVRLAGGRAYLGDGFHGLQIIDISDPLVPSRLYGRDSMDGWDVVYDLQVDGSRVYTAISGGLKIWDVSDPQRPAPLGSFFVSNAKEVHLLGGAVLLVSGYAPALHLVDVTVPSTPREISTFGSGTIFGPPTAAAVAGKHSYVVEGSTFIVVDFSDPAKPRMLGSCVLPFGDPRVVKVRGSLVVVASSGQLCVVDVAAASKPAVLGSCTTQASNFGFDLEVTPDYAFVTSDVPGSIQAVDIRDPRNPAVRGGFNTAYAPRGLTVVGEYFHIANGPMGYVVSPNPWLAVAPVIDPQPVPLTIPNGGAAVFAPQVRGTLPLNCVWTRDGTPLAESIRVRGVASSTLAVSDCSRADEGAYVLTVSNVKGSATSDAATLTLDANRGFLSSALNTNGIFQLKVPTIAGASYRVQVSTNLLTWDDFDTVQGTGAAVVLSDPATANAPGTYFRVLKD